MVCGKKITIVEFWNAINLTNVIQPMKFKCVRNPLRLGVAVNSLPNISASSLLITCSLQKVSSSDDSATNLLNMSHATSDYQDLSRIPPSSNHFERFFQRPKSSRVPTDQRLP